MNRHRVLPSAAGVAMLTTGLVLLGGSPAHAETGIGGLIGSDGLVPLDLSVASPHRESTGSRPSSDGRAEARSDAGTRSGGASGNRVDVPVSVPVNACGISLGVAGKATGDCSAEDKSGSSEKSHLRGDKSAGTGSDNQINVPITVPVNVCGNAVSVLGRASGSCGSPRGQAATTAGAPTVSVPVGGGVLAGNTVNASLSVPVSICGNAVALPGGSTEQSCGAPGEEPPPGEPPPGGAPGGVQGPQTTPAASGVVEGNLPFTGIPLGSLLGIAMASLLAGAGALRLSRAGRLRAARDESA